MRKFIKYFLFCSLIFLLILNFYYQRSSVEAQEDDLIVQTDSVESVPVYDEYGFSQDSFTTQVSRLKPNQFLADILLAYDIPYPQIDKLVKKAREIFDVKNLRSGQKYSVLISKDSLAEPHFLIYEESPVKYVVFDLRDTFHVYVEEREIETKVKTSSGIINSSLYETMQENNLDASLAAKLADIYAWTIDFYRIQKGDWFRLMYEERFVLGKSIGTGKIIAAEFSHKGEDFYSFYFQKDEVADYFDEQGKGLKKAFLKSPLKFSRISSRFTMKRFHPVQKIFKAHLGTDYAAPKGTPILSVGDGTIEEAGYKQFNGNYVKVKHNSTYTTQYLHMSKIAKGMKKGARVKQSEVIGYVGSTGLATGPHVCFRFWKNGKQSDHLKEKFPSSEPVKKEHMEEYLLKSQELKKLLDEIGKAVEKTT